MCRSTARNLTGQIRHFNFKLLRKRLAGIPIRYFNAFIQPCDHRVGEITENALHFMLIMNDTRHIERMEHRAIAERGLTEHLTGARDVQPLQSGAFPEGAAADARNAFRQHHTAQRTAAIKRACADTSDLMAHADLHEGNISAEKLIRQNGQSGRKLNALQRRQIHKCAHTDFLHAFRNHDFLQPFASGKCLIVDVGSTVLENDLLQFIQIGKGVRGDDAHGGRNHHTLDAS